MVAHASDGSRMVTGAALDASSDEHSQLDYHWQWGVPPLMVANASDGSRTVTGAMLEAKKKQYEHSQHLSNPHDNHGDEEQDHHRLQRRPRVVLNVLESGLVCARQI